MYYIGIDVGGTGIKAGLVKGDGEIVKRLEAPTEAKREAREIAETIGNLALSLIKESGIGKEEVHSVGIGIPGACNGKTGEVLFTPNINFGVFPLGETIEKMVGRPVFLANDADCAALGEYKMLPEKVENMVLVTLGTGIGSGLIINGRLYTGFNGIAGEIGHNMLFLGGRKCSCGREGCFEAYGSVTALISDGKTFAEENPKSNLRRLFGENFENLSGKTIFEASKNGDKDAERIVNTWISYVAEGVTDLVNIFQPEVLLIGGSVSRQGEYLAAPIRKLVNEKMYKSGVPQTKIGAAALGGDAGIIGAAFLGKE